MAARPTREFKTSRGHTLVLNEYITGAENWQIKSIHARARAADADLAAISLDAEKKALSLVIVSFDGSPASVVENVLALPLAEYREVTEELAPIMEAKKKSETS